MHLQPRHHVFLELVQFLGNSIHIMQGRHLDSFSFSEGAGVALEKAVPGIR